MSTSARCPRCDNWAQIARGTITSHKSNEFNARRKLKNCSAAGRTLEQVRAEMTPEMVIVRNHLKRQRMVIRGTLRVDLRLDLRPGPNRYRHALTWCPTCDKAWYDSISQAQRIQRKALIERETVLYIYYCPADDARYHVTKMEEHDDRGEVL